MAEPTNLTDQNTTTTTTAATTTWGTLEELLLACAVNRHGTTSWDSIARELQKRMSSSHFTPHICQQKYRDLKRRFAADVSDRNAGETAADDGDNTGLWLDELRKHRVTELRRELERYDISIVSLQLKVKRLKKETEIPDLVNNQEREGTKNNSPETIADGESERRNESVNESFKPESEPDRISEPDSFNESSNSKDPEPVKPSYDQEVRRVDSAGVGESVAESKGEEEGVKDISDVQSTAWREKVVVTVVSGNSSGEENQSAAIKSANEDGKPSINFLKVVRASKLGSVFGRRLESQETLKYRNLIRQHLDLGMIQRRLEEGLYLDCHTKFYRDLMLLVNNAIVFFSNNSSEHKAAIDLRQLVTKKYKTHLKSQPPKHNHPPPKPPKIEPNPADDTPNVKPKLALNGPVIACRKRSSIAGKPTVIGERKEPVPSVAPPKTCSSLNAMTKKRTREQSFGSRSSSSKNNSSSINKTTRPSPSPSPIPKPSQGPTQSLKPSPSTPLSSEAKADKKKPSPANSSSKVKRGSGSGNGSLLDLLNKSGEHKNVNNKGDKRKDQGDSRSREEKENNKGKEKLEKESVAMVSRNTGRPPKTKRAVAATSAMGKRGREQGDEAAESLPKKRQRK